MSVAIVTGSAGLVGSEAVEHFAGLGMDVVGIDNDMRRQFFGEDASTAPSLERLRRAVPRYTHHAIDIRNQEAVFAIFEAVGAAASVIIHTAAQPSHDWAARAPLTDFAVNATGTLNVLEATRRFAPDAPFIFTSTNKVYGDRPNSLPLVEGETRWELSPKHPYARFGIPEDMAIDQSLHSVFGASKVAADVLVQEYGRYYGLKTACFRGGCLTGPNHSGAQLHGFLSYLVKCTLTGTPYSVFGYGGKQVRDNIHSADLIDAFDAFFREPRSGEVYNMGGGPESNCSMLEAIRLAQQATGRELRWTYVDQNRAGDHVWWVSDVRKFKGHYPAWRMRYGVPAIIQEIAEAGRERWGAGRA